MALAKKKPAKAAHPKAKAKAGAKKKDAINQDKMAAQYGFALAFMNSDPELSALFKSAVKGTWTPDMFVAKLRNTNWFKTNSASVRNAIMMQTSDPDSYKENVDKMTAQVRDAWGKAYGMDSVAGVDDNTLHQWGETAFRMGWTEEQLLDHMGSAVDYQQLMTSNSLGGGAAEARSQLRSLAENYGVDPGQTWMADSLGRLLTGDDTIEGVQARIQDLAKQQYGAFADQIDAGHTVAEIADPYKQKMADLLEMNPADINLKDGMIQKALTGQKDPKTGVLAAQNLNDFANSVRSDTRWQYTANAKQATANTTAQLLRSFGLMAS
jgi:hypothetical protein